MIKESLKIHGKKQFEIKQKVLLPRKSKEIRYQVESFSFFHHHCKSTLTYTRHQVFNVASKTISA